MLFALLALALAESAPAATIVARSIGATTTGTTGGAFNTPRGVAFNQSGAGAVLAGTFYVADSNNNRVQRFGPDGSFVSAWGWEAQGLSQSFQICTVAATCKKDLAGANAGQFGSNGAQGLAVDQGNGNVYVSDQIDRRIDIFTATGTFVGAFGWGALDGAAALQFCTTLSGCHAPGAAAPATGSVPGGQFGAAIGGVAVDGGHNFYVADKTSRRVDVFKPVFGGSVVTGVEFVKAFGWGAETGAAAFEVCNAPAVCHAPAAVGTGTGQFGNNSPSDVAVDSEGNVFALDLGNKRLQEFSSTATPITATFGSSVLIATFGTGELLNVAVDPTATPNHILVSGKRSAESNHVAVQELDHAGDAVQVDGQDLTANTANGLAVAQGSIGGNVYLSTNNTLQGVYVLSGALPTVAPPAPVSAHAATLRGTVVSEGLAVGYHFEYSADGVNWTSAPAGDATVPATPGSVTVEQPVSGLVGSQAYRVRVVSTRPPGGMALTSATTDFVTPPAEPTVSGTEARSVGTTTATLAATVNPQNQSTGWHFEYLSESDFLANGASFEGPHSPVRVPVDDASAGQGNAPVAVSETIAGLQPGTAYRFRLIATNASGVDKGIENVFATYSAVPTAGACPNEALRAFAGGALPDCRAYEQSSPVDKAGGRIIWPFNAVQAGVDGDRISFADNSGLPTAGGASQAPIFIASRGGGAWRSVGLLPLTDSGFQAKYFGWNEALSVAAAVVPGGSAPGLYLTDTASGDQQLAFAGKIGVPSENEGSGAAAFAGRSSQLLFESTEALLPGTFAGVRNAYVLDRGAVSLAGRVPVFPATSCDDGAGPACSVATAGTIAGPYAWSSASPSLTLGGAKSNYLTQNTISADGSKVFFTEAGTGRLYVREGGTRTVQASASRRAPTDPNGEKAAAFVGATPSGSRVFFLSCEKLTDDSTAVSTAASRTCSNTAQQGQDLYAYDTGSGQLTDLTVDHEVADSFGAQVVGFVGASSDGAYAYVVANGDLASGAGTGNCKITARTEISEGACNLYLIHQVGSRPPVVTLVARLDNVGTSRIRDSYDWLPYQAISSDEVTTSARVSSSGAVVFSSTRNQTGYDSHGVAELYRFSPGDAGPGCVSCSPTGAGPVGEAQLQTWQPPSVLPAIQAMPFRPRNVSADGDRVFFQTPDRLVGTDVNGVLGCPEVEAYVNSGRPIPSCTDVYEWEAPGRGSCSSSSPSFSPFGHGCIYLISTGTSSTYSLFGDADEEGENAFFFTEQPLVPQDADQLMDVYDARVGGGLVSQQAQATASCTGEGCRAAGSTAPAALAAGTAAFTGPGNEPPAKKHAKHKKKHAKHKKKHAKHKKKHPKGKGKHGKGKGTRAGREHGGRR